MLSLKSYLQELESRVVTGKFLQELDASNAVSIAVDCEQVIQMGNGWNVPNIVAFEVEVLQVLVLSKAVAKVAHLGILSVLQGQCRERIWASIYLQ